MRPAVYSATSAVSLRQLAQHDGRPLDHWLRLNDLVMPVLPASVDTVATFTPRKMNDRDLRWTVRDGSRLLLNYAREGRGPLLVSQRLRSHAIDYSFDFAGYRSAPTGDSAMKFAAQVGRTLYVSYDGKSSPGNVAAIDVVSGGTLWHSTRPVANAPTFAVLGDYLLTGYNSGSGGSDKGILWVVRRSDGALQVQANLGARILAIIAKGEQVFVLTRVEDWVFGLDSGTAKAPVDTVKRLGPSVSRSRTPSVSPRIVSPPIVKKP